jgi:hypothetical protein
MLKHKVRKKARVAGLVTDVNEKNMRVEIPKGNCVVIAESTLGPFTLTWIEEKTRRSASLTLKEYVSYRARKALKVVGEP